MTRKLRNTTRRKGPAIAAVAVLLWLNFKRHDPADLLVNQVAAAEEKAEE